MIRRKKIMEEYFPTFGDPPKEIQDEILDEANDGKLLYAPIIGTGNSKKGNYFCLRCGAHGEIEGENIMCLSCNNRDVRPFQRSAYDAHSKGYIRCISTMDEYTVLRDFEWKVTERVEVGPEVYFTEQYRTFINESDFAVYECNKKYVAGQGDVSFWCMKKKFFDNGTKIRPYYLSNDVRQNPLASRFDQYYTRNANALATILKQTFSVKEDSLIVMPEPKFKPIDYSIITDEGMWTAFSNRENIPGTEDFERLISWCSNCGEYHEAIREKERYGRNDNVCVKCGSPSYQSRNILYIIVDAIEVENDGVMLQIHGAHKRKTFEDELERGVNPKVGVEHIPTYTEYVYVTKEGNVSFYNEDGEEIEELYTPKTTYRNLTKILYTADAERLIKESKALDRTGYPYLMKSECSPRYFEYYKGMPCIEIFAKMGMNKLVMDIMDKELSDIPQYLRKTGKESRLSRLTKPQINSLRKSGASLKHLLVYMKVLNKDEGVLFDDFQDVASRSHERFVLDIMNVGVPGMTVAKIKDYMERVDDAQCCQPSESMQLWSDYLRMLKNLEADLTDTKLVFPNSLKREHDKAARKVVQVQDKKLIEKFEQKASDNDWLTYKGSTMSVRVPHLITELYEEGRRLNHCVGSYAKQVSDGTSIIAFIRRNQSIDEPFCTVEVRGKSIVQARGLANRHGTTIPGIKGFLDEWAKEKGLTLAVA